MYVCIFMVCPIVGVVTATNGWTCAHLHSEADPWSSEPTADRLSRNPSQSRCLGLEWGLETGSRADILIPVAWTLISVWLWQ